MNQLAIVIPVYRERLSKNETISLTQALRCFKNYNIFFLAPEGLKIDCQDINSIKYEYFDPQYFKNVRTYSCLMLNSDVYKRFCKDKYILIYQLDAFVFRSGIEYFLYKNYDYIGAPTLEGMLKPYREEKVLFTQNGGFSLRRIEAFVHWTEDNKKEISLMHKYDDEDSIIYALRHKGINMAPEDVALEFAFDSNVGECFKRTNGKCPFGCHAWERYDFERWRPLIEEQGYKVENVDESRRIIKDYYYISNNNRLWIENYSSEMVSTSLKVV